jgi:hypothetical protein
MRVLQTGGTDPMQVTVKYTITPEQISNLMISAIESGDPVTTASKGGWCWGIYWRDRNANPPERGLWYADTTFWGNKPRIQIVEVSDEDKYDRERDMEGNIASGALKVHTVAAGLATMASKYPSQFKEILNDNADAPCADLMLQCILFGEEKYA